VRDILQKREEQLEKVVSTFPPQFRNLLHQIRQNKTAVLKSSGEDSSEKIEKLKLAEEVVTKHGNKVLQLIKLKQEAIYNEDYMTA